MKKIIIFILVLIASTLSLAARTQQFNKSSGPDPDALYISITIHCNNNYCYVHCTDEDPTGERCCFSAVFSWCNGCFDSFKFYQDSRAEELYDYAEGQVRNNILSGDHTSNIIIEPGMRTFYRNISWQFNEDTGQIDYKLTVTEPD